jgi:hypothetical protein
MRSAFCLSVILTLAAPLPTRAAPSKAAPPRPDTASPLTLAAWKPDHHQIKVLLAAGQDPNAPGLIGLTPWMWSLLAQDRTGFRMMMDSMKDFRPSGGVTTEVFLFQVLADEREIVRELLKRGISVDAQTSDGTNGLMIAAANGLAGMVGLLLERGAQVNVGDRQGDTALMAAVRAGSIESIGKLLAAGAKVDQPDKLGNRAITYARRTGRQDVQRLLQRAGARVESAVMTAAARPDSRSAVARSLPLLEKASKEWMETRSCNACHLQPVMLQVNAVARAQGFPVDKTMRGLLEASVREDHDADLGHYVRKALETEEGVAVASLYVAGDQAYSFAQSYASALDAGLDRQPDDRDSVRLLAKMQQPDGSWRHGPDRVPMQSGPTTSTALAARVLRAWSSQVREDDLAARVARARDWLVASAPRNIDDAAFKLLGLRWLDADAATIAQAAAALRRRQLPGGGWSQVDGLNPDAYATGLALVALAEGAGTPGTDPTYQRGVAYLLDTQEPDGSWLVHKRSVPVNRYFESGFPHGKFQFSSFVGTAWATMALMYAPPAPKRS